MIGDHDCFTAVVKSAAQQLHLGFQEADVGDVLRRTDGPQRLARLVVEGFAALPDLLDPAIGHHHPVLDLVRLSGGQRSLVGLIDAFPVFFVDQLQEMFVMCLPLCRIDLENPVKLVRPG